MQNISKTCLNLRSGIPELENQVKNRVTDFDVIETS